MAYGKVPPQSRELEEAVLGAVMLERAAFDIVINVLKPECFYVESSPDRLQGHCPFERRQQAH